MSIVDELGSRLFFSYGNMEREMQVQTPPDTSGLALAIELPLHSGIGVLVRRLVQEPKCFGRRMLQQLMLTFLLASKGLDWNVRCSINK